MSLVKGQESGKKGWGSSSLTGEHDLHLRNPLYVCAFGVSGGTPMVSLRSSG